MNLTEAQNEPRRQRASGRVQIGRDARIQLCSVPLASIRGYAPALKARDARLDLARSPTPDLRQFTADTLDFLLCYSPPWVIERGSGTDRHLLIVAGGELISALRRSIAPTTYIPVLLIDAKFSDLRWLQVAAAHAAAANLLASAQSDESLAEILHDAAEAGVGILKGASLATQARELEQGATARKRGPGRPTKASGS